MRAAALRAGLVATLAVMAGGCAVPELPTLADPPPPVYLSERFDAASSHAHRYPRGAEDVCEGARRALLSQGYVVTAASGQEVTARKYFQPDVEHHVQLEFRVVCAPEGLGQLASVAFASALKDQYVVRKVKESASLGVGGIGSLSLPLEGSMDSMVKIASETVSTAEVYERLFNLMGEYLGGMSLAAPPRAVRPS